VHTNYPMAATVWRGRIAFGLVSIPVRLYKAARRERVRFHRVYRPAAETATEAEPEPDLDLEDAAPSPRFEREPPPAEEDAPVQRVHTMLTRSEEPEPVRPMEVLKGFEVEKGRYAVLKPQEIAAVRPKTSTEIDLTEFIHLQEIDPVFFDASFYATPDKGGDKPYALLFQALQESGYAGLGTLAMHGRDHSVVIRPGSRGIIVHTLFYPNEVRAGEEFSSNLDLASKKETEMAIQLVRALAAPFDPAKLKSTYEERLKELVAARTPAPLIGHEEEPAARAPVIDIMQALKASLDRARKPAARETGAPQKRARVRRQ
jgi:DNA end-binding protein Ku